MRAPSDSQTDEPCDLGAFRLEHFVAAGAMGEVWRARHRRSDHPVAIKVITRAHAHQAVFRDGLRREVQAMAGLRHPGIAAVLDFGLFEAGTRFAENSPYYAMEWAPSGTLAQAMARGFDWTRTQALLHALLDALAHAHARGVVHRDLKPDNVLDFATAGQPPLWKLVDFGIAHSSEHRQTGHAEVMGTPAYMAPEQFLGQWRDFGPWTDLYAVGCIAHEIAHGRRPYPGKTVTELAHQHLGSPIPPFAPRMAVPDGFEEWVNRLLAKSPHLRFPCAADAAWALRKLGTLVEPLALRTTGDLAEQIATRPAFEAVAQTLDTAASLDETWLGTQTGGTLASRPASRGRTTGRTGARRMREASGIESQTGPRFAAPPVGFEAPALGTAEVASDALAAASIPLFGLRAAPFVGREDERKTLWDTLERVYRQARAEVLILEGTAGAGKSQLAEWMCHHAAESGAAQVMRTAHGRRGGATSGLAPMVLRHHRCAGLSALEVHHRMRWLNAVAMGAEEWDLEALVRWLVNGTDANDIGRAHSTRERFGLLSAWLQRMSRERPLVIWLDDAHWSEETVGWVRFVMRWTSQCPVLFLLTVRTEDLVGLPTMRTLLDELSALDAVQRLPLAPFGVPEMQALIAGRLTVDEGLARRIAKRSHGNPLFVVQLLDEWVTQGILRATATGFEVPTGVTPTLPEDLHAVWSERVERLLVQRSDGLALHIAAVLGLRVERREWQLACAALDVPAADDLIATMVDQGLARWTPSGFAFAHGLLQASVLRTARTDRWQAIQAACAQALAELARGQSDAGRIGRHLLEAGQYEAAVPALLDGASHAYGHAESDEAFALLELADIAIDALGQPAEPAVAAWTLRGRICSHLGRRTVAETYLQRALDAAQAADLHALHANALLNLAVHCRTYHASEQAAALASEALQRFKALDDQAGCGWSRVHLAHVLTNGPDAALSETLYRDALVDFEALDDPLGKGQCLRGLGWLRQAADDTDAALVLFEQAHTNLLAGGHRILAMAVHNDIADLHRATGALEAAEAIYRRALALFESVGHVNRSVVRLNLGMIALQRGRFVDARALAEQALHDVAGDPYLSVAAHAQLLVCAAAEVDESAWAQHFPPVAVGLKNAPEIELDDALSVDQAASLAHQAGRVDWAIAAARIGHDLWQRLERPERAAVMHAIVGAAR